MLLAHRLWEEVPPGGRAGPAEWERALEAALLEVEPELDSRWARLSVTEQESLAAAVAGGGSRYRGRVLARLGLSKRDRTAA
jgi:hypothetical protein